MLDTCVLRSSDQTLEGGGEVQVSLDEFLNYPFALVLDSLNQELVDHGAEALRLHPADIDLLLLVVAPRLRLVDIVFRQNLSNVGLIPSQIVLGASDRPRALRAPHGGADLRVYICLNHSLEERPLLPWRKGTWLGQQEFRVRSGLSGSGFVPIRLTDDDRERLGIPKDGTRFATLEENDPFDREPSPDIVKLYVDGDLLDRLAVAVSTPVGKHIQRQLFVDVMTVIVLATQRRLAETPELRKQHVDDFSGSLVHKLTEIVAGKGLDASARDLRQTAFRRLCDAPTVFLAHLEAKTGMRAEMLASFGDIR